MRRLARRLVPALWLVAVPATAGELEDQLRARWNGSWVVLGTDTYSGCDGSYTNNDVAGARATSQAPHRLPVGELGRVYKVNVQRSRVDVLVDVEEPLLVSWFDGPFELYDQVPCRVELQIQVPRPWVKDRRVDDLDDRLGGILESWPRRSEAEQSSSWNRRRVEPMPEDYESTLAEYDAWKVAQLGVLLRDTLDEARRLTRRVVTDEDYTHGVGEGIRRYSRALPSDCGELLEHSYYPSSSSPPASTEDKDKWRNGFREGQRLAYLVDLAAALSHCIGL